MGRDATLAGKVRKATVESRSGDVDGVVAREEEEIIVALDFVGREVSGLGRNEIEVVVVVANGKLKRGAWDVGKAARQKGKGKVDDGVVIIEEVTKGGGEEGSTKHGGL